jgi:hypothetical protein
VSPVGDAAALAANLLDLLEHDRNATASEAARRHFEATYSFDAVRPRLAAAYRAAAAAGGATPGRSIGAAP